MARYIGNSRPGHALAYATASGGKPYCGYNSSNGCCGLPAQGGNCNAGSLNFASLGTNNPCPGCYSQPNAGRHHCCPDRPPFNGGGPCVCSGKGYGGGSGGSTSTSGTSPSTTSGTSAPPVDTSGAGTGGS